LKKKKNAQMKRASLFFFYCPAVAIRMAPASQLGASEASLCPTKDLAAVVFFSILFLCLFSFDE
jgi:hypothetical protein